MKQHNKLLLFFTLHFSLFTALSSCSEDKEMYPSIVTELVDCPTDAAGAMKTIVLDDDSEFTLTNPQSGLQANVVYRALAGYTVGSSRQATLYSLTSAHYLRDSTSVAKEDPTNVASLWRTPRYINFHLLPKTQGGKQTWGFIVEKIEGRHAYLRLHHRQGSDPTSYTTDVYASLSLSDIDADHFTIRIETFSGTCEWAL